MQVRWYRLTAYSRIRSMVCSIYNLTIKRLNAYLYLRRVPTQTICFLKYFITNRSFEYYRYRIFVKLTVFKLCNQPTTVCCMYGTGLCRNVVRSTHVYCRQSDNECTYAAAGIRALYRIARYATCNRNAHFKTNTHTDAVLRKSQPSATRRAQAHFKR